MLQRLLPSYFVLVYVVVVQGRRVRVNDIISHSASDRRLDADGNQKVNDGSASQKEPEDAEEETLDPELHFGPGVRAVTAHWELKRWMPDSPGASEGYYTSKLYSATFVMGNVKNATKPKPNECLSTCKITDRGRCNKMGASLWGTKRTYISAGIKGNRYTPFRLCCIVEACEESTSKVNYEVIEPQTPVETRARNKPECYCCDDESTKLCDDEKNKFRCVNNLNLDNDKVLEAHCFNAMKVKPAVLPVSVDGYRAYAATTPHPQIWWDQCKQHCEQRGQFARTYSTSLESLK